MSNPELHRSIEAILMVVEEPVSEVVLAQIIEAPTEQVLEALNALALEYQEQNRGFSLNKYREVGAFTATQIWHLSLRNLCWMASKPSSLRPHLKPSQ